jgi:hypothetical protein
MYFMLRGWGFVVENFNLQRTNLIESACMCMVLIYLSKNYATRPEQPDYQTHHCSEFPS